MPTSAYIAEIRISPSGVDSAHACCLSRLDTSDSLSEICLMRVLILESNSRIGACASLAGSELIPKNLGADPQNSLKLRTKPVPLLLHCQNNNLKLRTKPVPLLLHCPKNNLKLRTNLVSVPDRPCKRA